MDALVDGITFIVATFHPHFFFFFFFGNCRYLHSLALCQLSRACQWHYWWRLDLWWSTISWINQELLYNILARILSSLGSNMWLLGFRDSCIHASDYWLFTINVSQLLFGFHYFNNIVASVYTMVAICMGKGWLHQCAHSDACLKHSRSTITKLFSSTVLVVECGCEYSKFHSQAWM